MLDLQEFSRSLGGLSAEMPFLLSIRNLILGMLTPSQGLGGVPLKKGLNYEAVVPGSSIGRFCVGQGAGKGLHRRTRDQ